jgi:ATP-dependent DNA helicase RecG
MENMIVRESRCMDDQELERLFEDLESDRVERKSAIANDKDKICEAICAFANDLPNNRKPGVLFVGVHGTSPVPTMIM